MRALVIAGPGATDNVQMMLAEDQFTCDTASPGEDSLSVAKHYDYDIIVVDLRPTNSDGYQVIRRLRVAGIRTPIVIVADDRALDYKITCFGFGADDFLAEPFDQRELLARIRAIIRRSRGHSQSTIRTGRLVVNLDTQIVSVDEQPLRLTKKEYGILELLSLRRGAVLTKEMILGHLYGGIDEPDLKIIDVYVCKLRKKLAKATGGHHYIETVWGRGYALRAPRAEQSAMPPAQNPEHAIRAWG
jgi:two-component system cell cycle response regulator CtrA